jgi:D-alanyl-D-alanine carboxypeptidase
MHPASLTKMMTCLLALEHGRKNDTISITPDVFVTKDSRVRPGDAFVVEKLIYEMMMQSDNVAAVALGKFVGGDTLTFHRMMNEKAGYLHMDSTHFVNANGMPVNAPSVGNMSTARDLLILSRYCMDDSLFAQIVDTRQMDIPFIDHRHMPIQNTNLLLEQYKGCIGVKTGYTRQAGACLASAATRNGITLHLVLLKSKTHASRFTESAILFDYGFNVMEAFLGHQDN